MILLEEDQAVPLLHASVSLASGGTDDPPGKEGTTRLLLRLLRRTAAGRTPEQNQAHLDAMGASVHGEVTRTHAALSGITISRSARGFSDFLADALSTPRFVQDDLDKIRREALAEAVESLDDDSTLVRRFFNRGFFAGHPLSRSPQGTPASLPRIELADLHARYDEVRRQKPVFSFAGATGGESGLAELRGWTEVVLERLGNKTTKGDSAEPGAAVTDLNLATAVPDPEGPKGRQLLFVDKPDRTQTQIMMGCLGSHPKDADHIALYLGHLIFGGTFTARLSQEVRAKRGWSYGAYSSLAIGRSRQPFSLWTFPAKEHTADCIELSLSLLARFIDKGVTQKELSAVKRFVVNSHAFSVDTALKRVGQQLDTILYDLPEGYHQNFCAHVKATTVEQVNAAITARLQLDHFFTTVVGTAEGLIEDVARAAGAQKVERLAYDTPD